MSWLSRIYRNYLRPGLVKELEEFVRRQVGEELERAGLEPVELRVIIAGEVAERVGAFLEKRV